MMNVHGSGLLHLGAQCKAKIDNIVIQGLELQTNNADLSAEQWKAISLELPNVSTTPIKRLEAAMQELKEETTIHRFFHVHHTTILYIFIVWICGCLIIMFVRGRSCTQPSNITINNWVNSRNNLIFSTNSKSKHSILRYINSLVNWNQISLKATSFRLTPRNQHKHYKLTVPKFASFKQNSSISVPFLDISVTKMSGTKIRERTYFFFYRQSSVQTNRNVDRHNSTNVLLRPLRPTSVHSID